MFAFNRFSHKNALRAAISTALAWLALAGTPTAWGTVRYVKANASGANTGVSWANAYTDLKSALGAAKSGDEIWVATGTYKPTTGTDRTISFVMPTSVGIYGGFAGTETALAQRNWSTHVTILSGEIGVTTTATDNSYHVVVGANGAVLDGFTITGGYASGSGANACGAGMINNSVSPTIANCTFMNNTADYYEDEGDGYGFDHGFGGGMYNTNSSPNVTNCTFTNNTAYDDDGDGGGGMCNTSSSPTVTNCTFTNNMAYNDGWIGGGGGGMYNESSSSPTVTNCSFTNNTARGSGNANCDSFYYGYGGGMYNTNSSPNVTNCSFTNNTAYGKGDASGSSGGGGMYNESASSPTVTNCTFTNNTAWDSGNGWSFGGGMGNDDYGSSSSPTVTNCTFTSNAAECILGFGESYGGGMSNWASSPTVTNCTFTNNTAYSDGGGMDGGNATNCTFTNNTAGYGGGMGAGSATNCTFTNNTAGYGGGMDEGNATNCTFTNNTASYGGGISYGNASLTVTNCIFWNNSATQGAEICIYSYGMMPTFKYCDIQGSGGSTLWMTSLGTNGGGNIDADPLFVDASSPVGPDGVPRTVDDGLRLTSCSPCINAGTATGASATDILYNPRVGLPDIGAYEYQASPLFKPTVTGMATPTNDTTPTWTWKSGGGGNGTFRYQMNSTTGAWTTTTGTSYTPAAALADGSYTLYVEERDAAGNWSAAGSYKVTVDTAGPKAPIVTVKLPTAMRPVWSWTSGGGGGNGTFGYKLDSGAWTNSKATVYVATTDLTLGTHVLYVHERDAAGNWSAISKCSVVLVGAAQDWQGYR